MTFEEVIKYKNDNYPDGRLIEKEITMKVVVVPNNQLQYKDYRDEVYRKLYKKSKLSDDLAKEFSPDGDYGLGGFALQGTDLIYKNII